MMTKRFFFVLAFLLPLLGLAQQLIPLTQKAGISFRGLDSYQDYCLWVSGAKGTVGVSTDAGKNWNWVSPKGYAEYDFRDIEAFSEREAVIVSAGTPAVILKTTDGGENWAEVYRDERPEIFLDGADFHGDEGYIVGDPINGKFQILYSKDRGQNWTDISADIDVKATEGEAAFAASGSSLRYIPPFLWLGTGGTIANMHRFCLNSRTLTKVPLSAMQQGEASRGVFSIDFYNVTTGIVVGGNYMQDKDRQQTVLLTEDEGKSWEAPQTSLGGYRSCVKYITANTLLATGTSGTDISHNGGQHWTTISTDSYNTIVKNASGTKVFFAGSSGQISVIEL